MKKHRKVSTVSQRSSWSTLHGLVIFESVKHMCNHDCFWRLYNVHFWSLVKFKFLLAIPLKSHLNFHIKKLQKFPVSFFPTFLSVKFCFIYFLKKYSRYYCYKIYKFNSNLYEEFVLSQSNDRKMYPVVIRLSNQNAP